MTTAKQKLLGSMLQKTPHSAAQHTLDQPLATPPAQQLQHHSYALLQPPGNRTHAFSRPSAHTPSSQTSYLCCGILYLGYLGGGGRILLAGHTIQSGEPNCQELEALPHLSCSILCPFAFPCRPHCLAFDAAPCFRIWAVCRHCAQRVGAGQLASCTQLSTLWYSL
jgi:hypothetical protein